MLLETRFQAGRNERTPAHLQVYFPASPAVHDRAVERISIRATRDTG